MASRYVYAEDAAATGKEKFDHFLDKMNALYEVPRVRALKALQTLDVRDGVVQPQT